MRILWLTNVPAYYRKEIWNNLSSRSVFTLVFAEGLAHFNRDEIDWLNWKVMFSPLKLLGKSGKSWSNLRNELALQDLVVICGWEKWYYIRALLFCKRHGIPTVVFYESNSLTHKFKGFLARKLRAGILNLGLYILAPSPRVLETLKRHNLSEDKLLSCLNPVDVDRISSSVWANRVEFPSNKHRFLYIGQLIERKNISNLIEAFKDSAFDSDLLTIVGNGHLRDELRDLCKRLALNNRVEMIPHLREEMILQKLSQHQTLVLPSTEEVWGMVAAEAFAAGLGVVVSENCGIAPTIRNTEGVQECSTDIASIRSAMVRAKLAWNGPFNRKLVDDFKPEHFCDVVIDLCSLRKNEPISTTSSYPSEISSPRVYSLPVKWTWITNVPANYRVAIWSTLESLVELKVYCLKQRITPIKSPITKYPECIFFGSRGIFSRINYILDMVKNSFSSDVVIVGGWNNPWYIAVIILRRILDKKTLIHYGSTTRTHSGFNYFQRKLRIFVMRLSTMVLAYGDSTFRTLRFEGLEKSKIKVMFNPVNAKVINQNVKRLRGQNPLISGHKYLYVGQLIERKGIVDLLYAFSEVKNANDILTIVGKGKLGKLLQQLILDLNLIDSVEFVNHLNFGDLVKVYSQHQTLVLPSSSEVWGLVVNEALAAQLNVVVSRKCGVSESLEGINQAFVYGDSIEGLIAAMRRSRDSWTGWIDVEIFLKRDSQEFAMNLIELSKALTKS